MINKVFVIKQYDLLLHKLAVAFPIKEYYRNTQYINWKVRPSTIDKVHNYRIIAQNTVLVPA